jgi:hypothetical protein
LSSGGRTQTLLLSVPMHSEPKFGPQIRQREHVGQFVSSYWAGDVGIPKQVPLITIPNAVQVKAYGRIVQPK